MTTIDAPPLASLRAEAEGLLPDIVALRRRLHRRPEIGLQLPETQAAVAADLRALGLEPHPGTSVSSLTATLEGPRPGPTLILRADMDALPVHEATGLDFSSEIDGAMHACGHDTHMAMLLGATRLLLAHRDQLAGRVLLMFQPGEEGRHGARFMLEDGLLEGPAGAAVTAAFAVHISTRYPTRTIHLRPGPMMAAADTFRVTVRGRGGHASTPHLAVDPIVVAAEIILALQTMLTRRIDANEAAVITVGRVEAGTKDNVIPETAVLDGTIRTVSEAVRSTIHGLIGRTAEGIAAAHGAEAEVEIVPGYPVTVNDRSFTERVAAIAARLLGEDAVLEMSAPNMGAEDFSYVLQHVPGTFVYLGARPSGEDPATAPQNHSNRVVFDEAAMVDGVALHAAVALDYLSGR